MAAEEEDGPRAAAEVLDAPPTPCANRFASDSVVNAGRQTTVNSNRVKEVIQNLGFREAVKEVYWAFESKEAAPLKRNLHLNPLGGVFEVNEPSSIYRKSLTARSRLQVLWLLLALAVCSVNLYELVIPNILQVKEMVETPDLRNETSLVQAMAYIMAFYEIAGAGVILAMMAYSSVWGYIRTGFEKWHQISRLAWIWLPTLTRFSAIKMLGRVHPKMVFTELQDVLEKYQTDEETLCGSRAVLCAAILVVWKILVMISGLAALLVKTVHLTESLQHEESSPWRVGLQVVDVVGYVNQCINIVDVHTLLKKEAMRFAFAGEDAVYQKKELVYEAVFAAFVAQGLWDSIGKTRGRIYAFAALFSFNHADVQRLAVGKNLNDPVKHRVVKPKTVPV